MPPERRRERARQRHRGRRLRPGRARDRHRDRRGLRQRPAVQERHALRHLLPGTRWKGSSVGAPVKYRGVQIGQVVSITPSFAPERARGRHPRRGRADQGFGRRRPRRAATPWSQLIEDGLRARLELASLITGQLYVGLNIMPGDAAPRGAQSDRLPADPFAHLRCSTDCSETLTDLLADRPKIEKGLDQMLELLNLMVAGGGAEQVTRTMARGDAAPGEDVRSAGAAVRDPRPAAAPASPTSIRPPRRCRRSSSRPVRRWVRSTTWPWGRKRPSHVPSPICRQASPTCAGWATSCRRWWHRPGHRWSAFAQTGLPSLQGLIQDMDRAVSEVSRTVRDLRQNPSQFLLGDPAAQGVKLQ